MKNMFFLLILVAGPIGSMLLSPDRAFSQDVIEFLTGAKVEGKVLSIDKAKKQVSFEAVLSGKSFQRIYTYDRIHAVTFQGKRFVLNEKSATPAAPRPKPEDPAKPEGTSSEGSGKKSPAEIKAIIAAAKTPPDWYDRTAVEHPPTLDLAWPEKPPGGWNNQVNVGQYYWDVINPNPGRWVSGARLMHHLIDLHKDHPEVRRRGARTLGGIYFNLFQDYARAAYWWQEGGVTASDGPSLMLAECYYRLGNESLAREFLVDPERPKANNVIRLPMIKLWGDMGEPQKAVKLAEMAAKAGGDPRMAYLFAGDALRNAGKLAEAVKYYQLAIDSKSSDRHADKTKLRAESNRDATRLLLAADIRKVADGAWRASSQGYEGPVEVEVEVASGKIVRVEVTEHREKQFYSALKDVPAQIIAKQGVVGVDATSHATITGEAIINASAKALASGAK